MPDHRKHRGPHPEDPQLFSVECLAALQAATSELSWLLTRGYAVNSSLKLVGDRHALNARQRIAVGRCACSEADRARREHHRAAATELHGQVLWIDGFNVLTSIEAALSGGVILAARDGTFRDMASMHGNYRTVEETFPAIRLLAAALEHLEVKACHWLLDQPVSNSGRLKTMLRAFAETQGHSWQVELIPDPDPVLIRSEHIVATSDSRILDQAERWFNLVGYTVEAFLGDVWRVDLSRCSASR